MRRCSKILLITLLIISAVISPVGAGVAHAGNPLTWLLSVGFEGVAYVSAQLAHAVIYLPSVYILRAAAAVFDSVVPYALGLPVGNTQNAFQSDFVTDGWGIMRDLTNMVFIFAMLYIAIATILQTGAGRNTRSLLINIILIALFVNFSLFLAQVVIDGTNLLALEFYRVLNGASEHGLAAIVLNGFNPQNLFSVASFEVWVSGHNQSNGVLLFLYLFGGVLNLVTAYMIFWAAFLFIGRIVILWILMILSPLAFAAYILPATQKYFQEWWNKLLHQGFVAPIFLFFFYILALFIGGQDSVLKKFLAEAAALSDAGDDMLTILFKVALGFALVIAFLVIALKQTKTIGGEAATWATKAVGFTVGAAAAVATGPAGAARLAKLAGAVGMPVAGMGAGAAVRRVAGVPLRPFREAAFAKGRAAAGEAAKVVTEAGAEKGVLGKILRGAGIAGLAGRAEAGVRANIKENIEKSEKDYEKLNEAALKTKYGYMTTTPEDRAAIIKVLGKRGKLKPDEKGERLIDPESIKTTLETVKGRGYDTKKEVEEKYLWQYAKEIEDRKEAAKTLSPEAFKEIGKAKRKEIGPDGKEIELPSDFFDPAKNSDGTENTEVFDIAVKNMTSSHFKMLLDPEVRSDFNDAFVKNLKAAMEREKKKKIEELTAAGKPSDESEFTIEDYFGRIKNTRGGAAIKDPSLRGFFAENDIPYKKKKKDKEETGAGGGNEEEEGEGEEVAAKTEAGPTIIPGRAYRPREETIPKTSPSEELKSAADIAAERAEAIKNEPPPTI